MSTANEAERRNALEVLFAEMEAARAMLAALQGIVACGYLKDASTAALDTVADAISQAKAAGIE